MSRSTSEMNRFIKFANEGEDVLEIIYFTSGKCNFNCQFCAFKDANRFGDTSIERTQWFVSNMLEYCEKHPDEKFCVNIMGGEPFVDINNFLAHFNILNELRLKYPNNIKLGVYTNGLFAKDENILKTVVELNIDVYHISCSLDHFSFGNGEYIANILQTDFKGSWIEFNVIDEWNIKPFYTKQLLELGVSQEDINILFDSDHTANTRTCVNLTQIDEIKNFYENANNYIERCMYRPFGIFITEKVIYTACGGEGMFPWCELSETLSEAIKQARIMYIEVDQYVKDDCLLTCRHFQQKGYSCKDCKHIKIDKEFNITEIQNN